jgi:sulfide dehydrogenase cytochrome subunit
MNRRSVLSRLSAGLLAGALALSPLAFGADAPAASATPAAPAAAPPPGAAPAAPPLPPMPPLPMASAAMLAGQCTGCHGDGGASLGPASPTIGGINQEYFLETMAAFKSGKRHSTVMGRIAKGYTDDEIKAMAGYFAKQKWVTRAQKTDPAKVSKGAGLHKKNCEKCHEENGKISEDGGVLAGQWLPYLVNQMEDYTSGKTKMPEKMDTKVKGLKPDEINALLHFYASQK